MSHILIVGKNFSGLTNYLTAHDHTYTLLQDELSTKYPNKKLRNRVVCSFSNTADFLAAARRINKKTPIDATMTVYENYVVANALIAEELGLPGMPEDAARACTDKELMRYKFSVSSEKVSPDFQIVQSRDDLIGFADSHQFPLILKPTNLAKSLLVTKNDSLDDLLLHYNNALDASVEIYKKYAPNSDPKFIVEEFLEGSIHSVDAFVDADGEPHILEQVVDYQTGYDIGFDDNFHYSRLLPSRLSPHDIKAIHHTAKLGCRLLGMRSSPAHIEIILTKDGPRIVEIGARNGGYRERMHRLANDIDITGNALAVALGGPLDIAAKKQACVGVFELFPKNPGIFRGIKNSEQLRTLQSIEYMSVKATVGQYVGKAGDGYKMSAVVILSHTDQQTFESDLHFLNTHVAVTTA